jgi:hypothetical protein
MSEYQYYEFQAIDRPLTDKQMKELRSCSTRARITRTSFINDYSWGNFKGDEDAWMEKYFDAFIYVANWGTQAFKLRLPSRLLNLKTAQEYCAADSAYAWESRGNTIVSFVSEEEGEWDWVEGDGIISPVLPVWAELAHGDLRALYLGWLLCVQHGELDDEDIEPAVPPGLGQPSASLESLASFLRIDEDQTLATELLQRFRKDRKDAGQSLGAPAARRTVGELLKAAQTRTDERRQVKARKRAEEARRREREAAAARARHLDEIAEAASRGFGPGSTL